MHYGVAEDCEQFEEEDERESDAEELIDICRSEYTFTQEPDGIYVVHPDTGYRLRWGSHGVLHADYQTAHGDILDAFEYWSDLTNDQRINLKTGHFNKAIKVAKSLSIDDLIEAKEALMKTAVPLITRMECNWQTMTGLICYKPAMKEEENMNTNFRDTKEGIAQAHLLRRADEAFYEADRAATKTYGLVGDDAPRSWNELLARITAGKFVISEENAKRNTYDTTNYVEWRDPAIKKDEAGYNVARTKLQALLANTKDAIIVSEPAEGLKAIDAIKNFKA